MAELDEILTLLNELRQDASVPKNIKEKVQRTITVLQEESEVSMKISKALAELDDIGDDINLQAFTRTQIWNIVSRLEKI